VSDALSSLIDELGTLEFSEIKRILERLEPEERVRVQQLFSPKAATGYSLSKPPVSVPKQMLSDRDGLGPDQALPHSSLHQLRTLPRWLVVRAVAGQTGLILQQTLALIEEPEREEIAAAAARVNMTASARAVLQNILADLHPKQALPLRSVGKAEPATTGRGIFA